MGNLWKAVVMAVMAALGLMMIFLPLAKAGKPDDPPPPAAIM